MRAEETIRAGTAAGDKRWQELRDAGWQCRRLTESVVCRGGKPEPLTEAELARLHTNFAERAELRFGPPQEVLALIHESPLYNEYRWRRSVSWGGRDWPELRFYVSADLVKLNLPNDQGVTEDGFVVRADGQLSYIVRWSR